MPRMAQVALFAVIGMPVYVCASGATPLAAVLIAAGLSPGAAVAFSSRKGRYARLRMCPRPTATWPSYALAYARPQDRGFTHRVAVGRDAAWSKAKVIQSNESGSVERVAIQPTRTSTQPASSFTPIRFELPGDFKKKCTQKHITVPVGPSVIYAELSSDPWLTARLVLDPDTGEDVELFTRGAHQKISAPFHAQAPRVLLSLCPTDLPQAPGILELHRLEIRPLPPAPAPRDSFAPQFGSSGFPALPPRYRPTRARHRRDIQTNQDARGRK